MNAAIKEIFESIQGEGILIGTKQVFVRFANCNLNCNYCDTDFSNENCMELNEEELFDKIKKFNSESVALTGGEPLLSSDFIRSFLLKYKKYLNKEFLLETNGTMYEKLSEVIDLIDIVSMDIKLKSATCEENLFDINDKFLNLAKGKVFIKVVFNSDIQDSEIEQVSSLALKYSSPLVLQPVSPIDTSIPFIEIYDKFYSKYSDVRLIPQIHPFLKVR